MDKKLYTLIQAQQRCRVASVSNKPEVQWGRHGQAGWTFCLGPLPCTLVWAFMQLCWSSITTKFTLDCYVRNDWLLAYASCCAGQQWTLFKLRIFSSHRSNSLLLTSYHCFHFIPSPDPYPVGLYGFAYVWCFIWMKPCNTCTSVAGFSHPTKAQTFQACIV